MHLYIQVIILVDILPHFMNMSYQQYKLHRLSTVNGVDIKNLRHLANVYKSLKDSNNGVQNDNHAIYNGTDRASNNEGSNEAIISSSNSNNVIIINTTATTTTTTDIIDNDIPSNPTTPTTPTHTPTPTPIDGYIELDFAVQKGLDMRNIAVFDIKEIQDTELEILKTHKVPHWCSLELLV